MKDTVDLIVTFKAGTDYRSLFHEFDVRVWEEVSENKFRLELPLQEGMGSSDIEDFSELYEVVELLWADGTPCYPRG